MGKFTVLDRERAQRKKEYLLKQEKKILAKRYVVELNEMKKNMQKRLELERRHLQRVKEELEKNSKAEKASMKRLQHQHKVSWPIFMETAVYAFIIPLWAKVAISIGCIPQFPSPLCAIA